MLLKLTYQTLKENRINEFIGQVKYPMFLNNYENNILYSLSIEENVDHIKGEYYIWKIYIRNNKIFFLMLLALHLRMLMG